jgi:predicted DNA-binding transcriptional regulator AlpA
MPITERKEAAISRDWVEPEYLTPKQVAQLTGFSVKTLERYRHRGLGPPYVKVNRSIRYLVSDVREWMENGGKLDQAEKLERASPNKSDDQ